ncbi:proline dehydrogenase family protein [Megalodesulfovibrio gigas]|uniref:L-glutamate gamma-semialdehyde dehydrogenase n=1 Tax=Megalodesulfovibrio gigas (strain ATCC 19364 / DSM 1382 / NCIMB 9332 / VKM B-1759) TaxID=1121448 RepID=T2GB03_MEGG1|nr:proline dehydrogenase family protein [Megalodesulfovibrio gigas]AGW13765.1 putative delta-1-pyrroline-5-carboxylate dehydrogenase [Megalodesulfovibrio gigas DSM 1382 = ATCC 19364]
MDPRTLEPAVIARGKEFFASISGEAPSIFDKGWWTGKVMDWSMKHEDFKVKMFRFVDVIPAIHDTDSLVRHIKEYFQDGCGELPPVMSAGLKGASLAGSLGLGLMAKGIRSNIEKMGRQFIVGQDAKEAVSSIEKLRKDGFAFVIDSLGEATMSEEEADEHLEDHLKLLDALGAAQKKWKPLGNAGNELDWGHAPKVNLAVKPTAFYSQATPRDFEGSVQGMLKRLLPMALKVKEIGGFLCIDMEQLSVKDITIEAYKRLLLHPELKDYPHLGLVLQTYLRDTEADLDDLLAWARQHNRPISLRMVKGAYWDYETVVARQNGWEAPVWLQKPESDACYERCAWKILQHADICHLACASHNIRTISAVMEMAKALGVDESRYEFQVLYGMAEPVRKGLKNVAGRVRLYCPYGDLIPGMAYLVRRLLENTANESFLRQSFVDEASQEELLADPATKILPAPEPAEPAAACVRKPFDNEAMVDFTVPESRQAFPAAIAMVRSRLGRTYPLWIDGKDVETPDTIATRNPARQDEVIGHVCQAGVEEVEAAIAAARTQQKAWARLPASQRADCLRKAAGICRERIVELSAWQVLEVGKQWDQAYADVAEAIDFLDYYANEAERLAAPRTEASLPGESNRLAYRPKGLVAVIAPWNFPFAISVGMCAAALVTGNAVLYKPSSLSSVVGYGLKEVFQAAGIPGGVFNYLPGRSSVMGDHLVGHKDIHGIAFTGSMEVGLHIIKTAAVPAPGQAHVKRVIAEMGGKNAIVIDDDAELDEAVAGTLYSAFGFQGQKCSACSRVIVLDGVCDRFVPRLVAAARSVKIGPAEDSSNVMGPVIDPKQQRNVNQYVELAHTEGNVLLMHTAPQPLWAEGCYVPLTIVEGITPQHRLAQEEIFGPVLSVMRAKDFDQAMDWANSTQFALTAGLYSRSPARIERFKQEMEAGNLYINRGTTGALVHRQPFGGFKLSGVGSKAGGPDYLLQFVDPVNTTENTMRRGFAPVDE